MKTTSEEALDSIDPTRLEQLAYETIYSYGPRGCISDEVRQAHKDLAYSSVTARWANLERKGKIVRLGDRRKGISGRSQYVMRAIGCVDNALRLKVQIQLAEEAEKSKKQQTA
jgi:hypothetical protein